ncbi:L,D-transpeptidase family protein [Ohtaekwangia koreensis]|uniref:L,D-transpeptidase catalytic domain n=1 Tax=Ohtaekwangia koreensis TaxID=688867 RepID=A0A1T5K4B3_9BACT|nr:L,D-transpeptidase [Ohtaekwangia koreensis]SKC58309.1 L,D-transpeptidase catalytic domain [Ohtaekwangia koreensis]
MKRIAFAVLFLLISIPITYYFWPEQKLPPNTKIDKLIVNKAERTMTAFSNGRVIKVYTVSLGQNAVGDKEYEGDKRTPEGKYIINAKNPNSGYYKNLGISYPDKAVLQEAKSKGMKPGGEVKIHGLKNGNGFIGKFHRMRNWTAGCIAVTNNEMEELYTAVSVGTPIVINP